MYKVLFFQICLIGLVGLGTSFVVVNHHHHHHHSLQQHDEIRASSSSLKAKKEGATNSLSLFSPCKINLFLRIIRKRSDGYHDLASLFQAVGFGDSLELALLDDDDDDKKVDEFTCDMPGVPTDDSNLVLRALKLMREKTGIETYFKANLIKKCPAQAGLGGGSANAATAMFGANQLMGNPATLEQLVEWSADLGSDITFFLSRGTAYCTGRGEIMTPIEPPLSPGTELVIVKPSNIGLSTPSVFKSLDYDALSDLNPEEILADFCDNGVDKVKSSSYVNDLEPPAFSIVPKLQQLKQELQAVEGFTHVMMSGSGTSIFCLGRPVDQDDFDATFGTRSDLLIFPATFISRSQDEWYSHPTTTT